MPRAAGGPTRGDPLDGCRGGAWPERGVRGASGWHPPARGVASPRDLRERRVHRPEGFVALQEGARRRLCWGCTRHTPVFQGVSGDTRDGATPTPRACFVCPPQAAVQAGGGATVAAGRGHTRNPSPLVPPPPVACGGPQQ